MFLVFDYDYLKKHSVSIYVSMMHLFILYVSTLNVNVCFQHHNDELLSDTSVKNMYS